MGCHFLLQGIFLTQGWNPDLTHCRQTLYHLSHQGSLKHDFRLFPEIQSTLEMQSDPHRELCVTGSVGFLRKGVPGICCIVATSLQEGHSPRWPRYFYFLLGGSWWTLLWQIQVASRESQPFTHMHAFSPKLPSLPGCRITVSRVPCAGPQDLVRHPLWVRFCVHGDPELPNYPFPPFFFWRPKVPSLNLWICFCFVNKFICVISF